jgi:ligand-binding sensor domain-containing protein
MKKFVYLFLLISFCVGCKKTDVQDEPDGQKDEWVIYNTTNSGLPDNQINAIAVDKNNIAWAGTPKGLAYLENGSWKFFDTSNSPLPSSFIRAIAVEEVNIIWIGTDKGVARYDNGNWQVFTTGNSPFTNNAVMCMTYNKVNKTLWIGFEGGELASISAQSNWKVIDAGSDLVLSMSADQNGDLWVGTFNSFAFTGSIKKWQNNKWTSFRLPEMGYPSAFPYALTVDNNNNVLAALSGTSVKNVIRQKNSQWEEMSTPENAGGFKTLVCENNSTWAGGNYLYKLESEHHSTFSIPGANSGILSMTADTKGKKWLGTLYSGVVTYE